MKILLVGSGAREHALAWKIKSSTRLDELFCAPGNAGTALCGTNVDIKIDDADAIADFACQKNVDIVVVGPELPLSRGVADKIAQRAILSATPSCFGPSCRASRIESSKAFSKSFMKRHGIPTADYEVFSSYREAAQFVQKAPWPYVIKASGLASGKGVFLPSSGEEADAVLKMMLLDQKLGESGTEVVIEERLTGEEVSILGFCDGRNVSVMPPAQDHKRLCENDSGPNTGGMGAIASALPANMMRARALADVFLRKACEGLASEGSLFVGVLYAGLILTPSGPKALEYNCRFGDPEAQAILPLLKTDAIDIFEACTKGRLGEIRIEWEEGAAACVVVASDHYATDKSDDSVREIVDYGGETADTMVFHAATRRAGGKVYAKGGRLLCVSAWGGTLDDAIEKVYARTARLDIPASRYRRDIGAGKTFLNGLSDEARTQENVGKSAAAYATAGVDIEAGDMAVNLMSTAVRSTYGPEVIAGIGAFGGIFDAHLLRSMASPVLVSSTDGVGTKVKLAAFARRFGSIGQDIVNHCIDDILVQGARPLFFLDYYAASKLDPAMVAEIVSGMALSCRESGCALIGGETAEMPGVYMPDEFDIAGTIVGVAEKDRLLPRQTLCEGDMLVGFSSSGPHTNGYSLIRKIFPEDSLSGYRETLGMPLIDALLAPHRSYLPLLWPILQNEPGMIKALAHITGGGFDGNIPRVLPSTLDAHVQYGSWPVPPLFSLFMEKGAIERKEMYRVFNMGIGMVAVVSAGECERLVGLAGEPCFVIGELKDGRGSVVME